MFVFHDPGKLIDDFVDELMGNAPIVSHPARVTLTDALLVLVHIKETKLDGHFIALD